MSNNTTIEVCMSNILSDQFVYITNIIWQISGLLCVILGIPGHILQIILLSDKTSRKEPTSLYFIAIAICEIVNLLGLFWFWCKNVSLIKIDPRAVFSCGIFYIIIFGSATLSNLYLASMSIDRSILILSPARYRLLITPSRVIIRIVVIFVIVFILFVPHHFYFVYEPKETLFLCKFHPWVNKRRIQIWSLTRATIFVLIPSMIIFMSSFILLHNRCKHKRAHKKTLSPSARRLFRHSVVIFFVSIGIIFFLLPVCILELFLIYDRSIHRDKQCSTRFKIYRILMNCFLSIAVINYSMKFYISLTVSTLHRERFIQLITCKSSQKSSRMSSENKNEQQLLSPVGQNKVELIEM